MSDVCGRPLKTTVRTSRALYDNQTIWRLMRLQNVSLVLHHASTDGVLYAPRQRSNIFELFNVRGLFKNAAGISIHHLHSAHSSEKSNDAVRVRKAYRQRSGFLPLRKILQLMSPY